MSRPALGAPRLPHPTITAFRTLARTRAWRIVAHGDDFLSVALGDGLVLSVDVGERTPQTGGRQATVSVLARLGSASALAAPTALADAMLDRLADVTFATVRARELTATAETGVSR
jgi:hypothetical protein